MCQARASSQHYNNMLVNVQFLVASVLTYCCVIEDDITACHVAMENVFLQVLYQSALREKWQ